MQDAERVRFSRQIRLPQIGESGQQRLLDATALIVGMGGLGSPVSMYLTAAGVGHLVISDFDRVDESNLQRQIVHGESSIGESKASSAKHRLLSINSRVHTCVEVIDPNNLPHFLRTDVDEVVSVRDISNKLLVQAAVDHGITEFYMELLTFQEDGNEVYRIAMPPVLAGRTFVDVFRMLSPKRMILTGIFRKGKTHLNPNPSLKLRRGDDLWIIAFSRPDPETITSSLKRTAEGRKK